jgi:hypothetical protein
LQPDKIQQAHDRGWTQLADNLMTAFQPTGQQGGLCMRIGCCGWSNEIDLLISNRIYQQNTVDALLQDNAVVVTEDQLEQFAAPPNLALYQFDELRRRRILLSALAEHCGTATNLLKKLYQFAQFTYNLENLFPSPEHSTAQGYYPSPSDFWWGGTEEMVITKGSDWCLEVARVHCALAQVSGIASRLVHIFSQDSGHAITECFIGNQWVLVDPLAPKVYTKGDGSPLSVVDMAIADSVQRAVYTAGREGYWVHEKFFQFMAVAEYRLIESDQYDYRISYCNEFYRKLLEPIWNR